MSSTSNSKTIHASPEALYAAFTSPAALEAWQAPGDMTAKVEAFRLYEGGGYEMSLLYPASETASPGKTTAKEDRFISRFITLQPPHKIVQAIHFDSENAAFKGEMIMDVSIEPVKDGTEVTIRFTGIPPGISAADNEKGTALSLEKLTQFVERSL